MIENKFFETERSLYHIKNETIKNCRFKSDIGESPLKECQNIEVKDSFFSIRYPFWHNKNLVIAKCELDEACRAPLWYCDGVKIEESSMQGTKTLRESKNIFIDNAKITSDEFSWNCDGINIIHSSLVGFYPFMNAKNVTIDDFELDGKYSFQYVQNMTIVNSYLNTKDAFWHTENVTVIDSVIKGEYLGWYSKNLKFVNCKIIGTQPLCYCENLILENCQMVDADLAFEYSSVEATIKGEIISVKNPLSGSITADKIHEVIFDENRRDSGNVTIKGE